MKPLYFQNKLETNHLILLSCLFLFPLFTFQVLNLRYGYLYDGDSVAVDLLIIISKFTVLDYSLITISIFAPIAAFIIAIILFTRENK